MAASSCCRPCLFDVVPVFSVLSSSLIPSSLWKVRIQSTHHFFPNYLQRPPLLKTLSLLAYHHLLLLPIPHFFFFKLPQGSDLWILSYSGSWMICLRQEGDRDRARGRKRARQREDIRVYHLRIITRPLSPCAVIL